ncbi:MAG TPA: ATP-binding protein [Rhodanobacteraceae bacterium]|nr:ATP-binding protein [Rhodanobacteraceae bacterium]
MTTPVLMSWSGGKDCLMALAQLLADVRWQVEGLLTTVTTRYDRVSMHGIRRDVLHAQADALGLPLIEAEIPWPADNASYEAAHDKALQQARERWPGMHHCAFGDIFLQDVRDYRVRQLARAGWRGVFPLWGSDTTELAHRFHADGHRANVVCVDTTQLDAGFCGREFDAAFIDALPASVDPCGENGEFHTLSHASPLFSRPLALQRGESVLRDERFQYVDFLLADVV